jgi:penicillin-binding protein 1B
LLAPEAMSEARRGGIRLRIPRSEKGRRLLLLGSLLAVAAAVGLGWLMRPFWQLSGQFDDDPLYQPSRLYGRSTVLEVGAPADLEALAKELDELGYRRAAAAGAPVQGRYVRQGGHFVVHLRSFPTPAGPGGDAVVEADVRDGLVRDLRRGGREVGEVPLEPPLLASYYGPDVKERRPVAVADLPEELIQAVLAAEDEGFFRHPGVSMKAILRAAWADLRGGEVNQGGSTLTQQLVKNLYLTPERSVGRKAREAVLAVMLELRYSKRQILQAYLNEIYLGSAGGANLHGVGAAARAYFGKDASDLDLAEAATLAGMIPAPAAYSPLSHPERARERRNLVLDRLAELGEVDAARAARTKELPLGTSPQPATRRRAAPYFADAAAEEARRRFGVGALEDAGYALLSTLSWRDQQRAEEAVGWGLGALEKSWQKGSRRAGPLQGALVSLDPRDGALLAYVGGRDYGASQFDRAGHARRQAGSAFKPVVYATAFEAGVAAPSSLVEDEPLTVTLAGQQWSPENDDREFRGWISVRTAVERSINVPTARIALETGLRRVVATARAMGVGDPLEPYPALALGAFELTPVELATVYATLAAGGVRPPVHGLVAVLDRRGQPLSGEPLPAPERVLSEDSAYLMTSVLQGVLDRGTARSVRAAGLPDPLAGKTGTTNGRRDSWFAGYSPGRTTVVWVGYDDNSPTRLSGARAALPIWGRFTYAVRPAGGYADFPQPPGVVTALIDPESGELATEACPEVRTEVFREGQVPREVCHLHRGWFAVPVEQPGGLQPEERRSFRRWLRKLFGRGDGGRP